MPVGIGLRQVLVISLSRSASYHIFKAPAAPAPIATKKIPIIDSLKETAEGAEGTTEGAEGSAEGAEGETKAAEGDKKEGEKKEDNKKETEDKKTAKAPAGKK